MKYVIVKVNLQEEPVNPEYWGRTGVWTDDFKQAAIFDNGSRLDTYLLNLRAQVPFGVVLGCVQV